MEKDLTADHADHAEKIRSCDAFVAGSVSGAFAATLYGHCLVRGWNFAAGAPRTPFCDGGVAATTGCALNFNCLVTAQDDNALRVAIFCGIGSAAMAEDSSRSGADPLCCKDAVIADYHDVNPKYGSLADFQAFLAAGGGQTSHVARVLPCLPAEFRLSNQIEL